MYRIPLLAVTNRPCQVPLGSDLDAYVRDSLVVMPGKPIEVEMLFDSPPPLGQIKPRNRHYELTDDELRSRFNEAEAIKPSKHLDAVYVLAGVGASMSADASFDRRGEGATQNC